MKHLPSRNLFKKYPVQALYWPGANVRSVRRIAECGNPPIIASVSRGRLGFQAFPDERSRRRSAGITDFDNIFADLTNTDITMTSDDEI